MIAGGYGRVNWPRNSGSPDVVSTMANRNGRSAVNATRCAGGDLRKAISVITAAVAAGGLGALLVDVDVRLVDNRADLQACA